ncbi:MAG: hypothetical protein J6J18_05615 [Oscillospiraceae bacterium]|nr:hypothetical protein [Oscillospiraceae bacterium]
MAVKRDVELTLISSNEAQNQYGVFVSNPTEREVFARVESVSQAEFFEGGRSGLNPEYKFIVFDEDYSGETVCKFAGEQFAIYRTYRIGDYIELYAERKGGTNGPAQG